MKTQYLSKEEREQGTRYFMNWGTMNGLGFSFLGDTIVYLLAIHFGASNLQLGYISSAVHVSGLILLILPWLLAGKNLVRILFYAWLVRGAVCIFYGLLVFLQGQSAVALILGTYTLFCISRTFGFAVTAPIQKMLSTSTTIGDFVVTLSNRFQTSRFLSQFLSFLMLSVQQLSGLMGYFFLITTGIIMNTLGALQLRRIPCREQVEYRAGQNIFRIFLQSIRHRERALTLFVKWHTLSVMILLSFIVPFLRKVIDLPSNIIFLYALTGTLSTILAGHALRPFTDRVGSRPVLILASFCLGGFAFIWCIIPASVHWLVLFPLMFMTIFFQSTVFLLGSRLEVRSIPQRDKMGYVSMLNFFSAVISLGTGLFGGFLADLGEQMAFPGLNAFGLTFLLAVILSAQIGILSVFLKDSGSLSVRDTAQILFSTPNLRAFLDVHQYHATSDPNTRKAILLSLGKSDTHVAADEMRKILRNPLSAEKSEILKSLFAYPKPALLDDILREAADEQSYHRATAIFALGAYPEEKKVERFLLPLLEHPSANIRSTAAKSLARVGNASALPQIQRLVREADVELWDRMNYLVAVSVMDTERRYLEHLFEIANHHAQPSYSQTIFSLAAKTLDMDPALAELYQEENLQRCNGLRLFLEETKQLQPFCAHEGEILTHYTQGRYQAVWHWCQELLTHQSEDRQWQHLRNAIQQHDLQKITPENTFAALYFTYQMLA